jgi:hypothetical protein
VPTSTSLPTAIGYAALDYAARGLAVFPLWNCVDGVCLCGDGATCGSPGKHPRTARGLKDATLRPEAIRAWWRRWPDANIGLPAGDNGYAIVDVDPRHGGDDNLRALARWAHKRHGVDLYATHTVHTGSGGLHLYYRQPPGGIKTIARAFGADGLDTRGRGGYVVAPPSIHATGRPYTLRGHLAGQPAPWPAILTRLMDTRPFTPPTTGGGVGVRDTSPIRSESREQRWAQRGLTAECDHLRNLPPGDRNNQLNHAAYKMGRRIAAGWIDETTVADALHAAASSWLGQQCTDREILATIASGLTAGKAAPHPGPTARAGDRA